MIVFLKSFLYIGIDGVDKRQLEDCGNGGGFARWVYNNNLGLG